MENSKSLLDKKIDLKWYFRVVIFEQMLAISIMLSMTLMSMRYLDPSSMAQVGYGSTMGIAGALMILFAAVRVFVAYKVYHDKNPIAYIVALFLALLSVFSFYFLGAIFELYVLLLKENRKEFLTKEFMENLKEKFV